MVAHGTCLVHPGRKGPHPAGLWDEGLASYGHLAFLGGETPADVPSWAEKGPKLPKSMRYNFERGLWGREAVLAQRI